MQARKYFPLGKAYGEAFCNRVQETRWLVDNLHNTKHSLLIAPRRYGKSSLAERAIVQAKLPFAKINFHLCSSEDEITQLIINNVIKLIGSTVGQYEKLIVSIKKYVSNLNPKVILGEGNATLELVPKADINQAQVLSEALLLLENLLKEKNKKAVLFFDEFQEIVKITNSTSIEGAIRTAAQEMQHLVIIFSGSIRSLLVQMFDDENRPLYKLCRKLRLERISRNDYEKHLNKIAVKTWGKQLSENAFNLIMQYSNRHPYYVNYLCDVLWSEFTKLPTANDVDKAWRIVVEEEWSDAVKEISLLSTTQRKLLKYIANEKIKNILSQEVSYDLNMPTSSINSAMKSLIEKDYLELDGDGYYRIINPLLRTVMSNQIEVQ